MSYAMLPTELLDQLERDNVSRDARLLFLEAITYALANDTDGAVNARPEAFSDADDPQLLAQQLVDCGVLVDLGDSFRIAGYIETPFGAELLSRSEVA